MPRRFPRLAALAALLALAAVPALAQDCPQANYTFYSQAQVDAFPSGCTRVTGNLRIRESPVLEVVSITDLTPLGALASVGGNLDIRSNPSLTSLDGLGALASVGGNLDIRSNSRLTSLDGLGALASVGGYLDIRENSGLTSLDGLGALASVGGNLTFVLNTSLTSLDGLGALASVGGNLLIQANLSLTSLDGLGALASVGGYLGINVNIRLAECAVGLDGLISGTPPAFTGVSGTVTIMRNGGMCNSAQQVLDASESEPDPVACTTAAPLSFDADGSGRPVTAADFNSLGTDPTFGEFAGVRNESADAPVTLAGCSFVAFDPFTEAVTFAAEATATAVVDAGDAYVFATTGGDQAFGQSDVLFDSPGAFALITGPATVGQGVTAFGGRVVAAVVYDRARDVFGSVGGNATPAEQEAFALAMAGAFGGGAVAGEAGPEGDLAVSVWPNPSARRSTVAFGLAEAGEARVSVVDALGREVAVVADGAHSAGSHEAALETAGLPAGVYVVRVVAGGAVQTARLTVAR